MIGVVKKLRWVVIASFSVLVACGSLWISQRESPSPPHPTQTVPIVRPALPTQAPGALPPSAQKITLNDVRELYRQGQRQLYNSTVGTEYLQARALLQSAQALLAQLNGEITETVYWQARLEFELGNWYHGAAWGDPAQAQEALPYYLTAERLARQLTERAPDFSEGYRLLGETQMRIISLKGWLQALTHAQTAKKNLDRAVTLDPKNAEAHLALGIYYLYAPTLFGGDLEKALSSLRESEALTSDETVRFLSYRWQGVAYAKLGKLGEAKEAFRKALLIYPKSSWDRNELNKLR